MLFQWKKEHPIKQSNSGFKMGKWSAFRTQKWSAKPIAAGCSGADINMYKKGLEEFTDDKVIRGIKDNLMQPLAPKASEPICWQKQGSHMRGRIILLLGFYTFFPVHSPDALMKPDKLLVWSRMATWTFWYGRNMIAASILFITQMV